MLAWKLRCLLRCVCSSACSDAHAGACRGWYRLHRLHDECVAVDGADPQANAAVRSNKSKAKFDGSCRCGSQTRTVNLRGTVGTTLFTMGVAGGALSCTQRLGQRSEHVLCHLVALDERAQPMQHGRIDLRATHPRIPQVVALRTAAHSASASLITHLVLVEAQQCAHELACVLHHLARLLPVLGTLRRLDAEQDTQCF